MIDERLEQTTHAVIKRFSPRYIEGDTLINLNPPFVKMLVQIVMEELEKITKGIDK